MPWKTGEHINIYYWRHVIGINSTSKRIMDGLCYKHSWLIYGQLLLTKSVPTCEEMGLVISYKVWSHQLLVTNIWKWCLVMKIYGQLAQTSICIFSSLCSMNSFLIVFIVLHMSFLVDEYKSETQPSCQSKISFLIHINC